MTKCRHFPVETLSYLQYCKTLSLCNCGVFLDDFPAQIELTKCPFKCQASSFLTWMTTKLLLLKNISFRRMEKNEITYILGTLRASNVK
mmetsp:Transcript_1838/g.1982  ORF Transcript_1838/g.1982 Transcript_1838/m.1982 type:complete len:89 (+) Transcript_1838:395-661(+)